MLLALAVVLAGPATAKKAPPTDPMTLKATGPARPCIQHRSNVSTKQASDSVLMFRSQGGWFRNELRAKCPWMRDDRVLVFRSTMTQYCELDLFDIVEPLSGMNFGSCVLGPFTPVEVPKGTRFGN
jgi:hypothetical protein